MDKKVRIVELISLLNRNTLLYDEGKPEMSDKAWDELYFELQQLEQETQYYLPNSPTQRINYEVKNELNKVKHNHHMKSLDKTKDKDKFFGYCGDSKALIMSKLDGLTLSLLYQNGELVRAETRGNGEVGEDVTHNAKVIPSIPNKIPYKGQIVIDGEILCTYSNFEKFKKQYQNPRNFASGSIRLLDSKECAKRGLVFVVWEVVDELTELKLDYLSEYFSTLAYWGFLIVPCYQTDSFDNLEDCLNQIKNNNKNFPIDGYVIKFDNIQEKHKQGETAHHHKGGFALKEYDEECESTLIDIEWGLGRTGQITPVAIFEPIEILDTVVERASLHNLSIMEKLYPNKWYKGLKVKVIKSNQIIPMITEVNDNPIIVEKEYLDIPTYCPICGAELEKETKNDSTILICKNSSCQGSFLNKLDHYCDIKKGLGIKGLSKATLEKLIDKGWIKNLIDIYNLSSYRNEWIKMSGFGEKSVDKALNAIEQSKHTSLDKFISAIGIPLIGLNTAKQLAKEFKTWDSFIKAVKSEYDFSELKDFGFETNKAILTFDYKEAKEISLLLSFEEEDNIIEDNLSEKNLTDLVFCITGKLKEYRNRDELIKVIQDRGGKVTSSVTKKTNYLINNDINSTSSKNVKAKELGIPILTEEDFKNFLKNS